MWFMPVDPSWPRELWELLWVLEPTFPPPPLGLPLFPPPLSTLALSHFGLVSARHSGLTGRVTQALVT